MCSFLWLPKFVPNLIGSNNHINRKYKSKNICNGISGYLVSAVFYYSFIFILTFIYFIKCLKQLLYKLNCFICKPSTWSDVIATRHATSA
ncbi:Protein of unknown function [Gryllus bimaculatus]|nr:Protein of unknown function [Gryllus bimaculatus]